MDVKSRMRIVIEIQSGPQSNSKLLLRPGQSLVFGQTEWADVVFAHDRKMSDRHFAVEASDRGVRLRDLKSRTGTLVNGEPVTETWLADGDAIQAGATRLAIAIEGMPSPSEPGADPSSPGAAAEPGGADAELPAEVRGTWKICDSGMLRWRGGAFGESGQPARPSELVERLARSSPPTLVVHPQPLERPDLQDRDGVEPLFYWLPAEAHRSSPLVLPADRCPDASSLVDAAWDQNAVVCFFSNAPPSELVERLREATQLRPPAAADGESAPPAAAGADVPAAILGYCWPAVLSPLLDVGAPELVTRLLDGIELVLMEVPDRPGHWQVLARPDAAETLEQAGFRALATKGVATGG